MNLLQNETSPYLLQHADNPVDWYAWSDSAFEAAIEQDKPIFLSIGYSTCHWCHVMAHESFADQEIARYLNDTFVCIKVDREERPDLDHIYMKVCQMMTGHGGWPLTVLMTPDKKPFWAGTYLPPTSSDGRLSVVQLCQSVQRSWQTQRSEIMDAAEKSTQALINGNQAKGQDLPGDNVFRSAYQYFAANYDSLYGGFGRQPKFPSPQNLMFLLRYGKYYEEPLAVQMVEQTLKAMLKGGLHDHLSGGFHRYSTDRIWLLPHFEKMLYDQAMMIFALTEASQVFAQKDYLTAAKETAKFLCEYMKSDTGGFYAAMDAETNQEEGVFYQWSLAELEGLLSASEFTALQKLVELTPEGNFLEEASRQRTGLNVLAFKKEVDIFNLPKEWESIRDKCLQAREQREKPGIDKKILTDWNSLAIAALARLGLVSEDPTLLEAASASWEYLEANHITVDGMIHCQTGSGAIPANLDDTAYYLWATFELYQATMNPTYLIRCKEIAGNLIEGFYSADTGLLYFAQESQKDLLVRSVEIHDGAMPAGFSVACMMLFRLAALFPEENYSSIAETALSRIKDDLEKVPWGHCMSLIAYLFHQVGSAELILTDNANQYLSVLRDAFEPNLVMARREPGDDLEQLLPFTKQMPLDKGYAFLCKNRACNLPAATPKELLAQLL